MKNALKTENTNAHDNSEGKLVLTPAQACELLQISIPTLRKLTNDGTIPCKRIGHRVRYPVDALNDYVNDLSTVEE
ncbi:helix-turn-helix domain-containing protein [Gimesia chilikensis]|uniref:helix-turn-helix domain-containing protein n=1 Tax=Gimesia chilikensis TaxID=2605989 RepID=UPI003A927AD1